MKRTRHRRHCRRPCHRCLPHHHHHQRRQRRLLPRHRRPHQHLPTKRESWTKARAMWMCHQMMTIPIYCVPLEKKKYSLLDNPYPTPPQPTTGRYPLHKLKKRELIVGRLTTPLDLSAAVGRIKGSRWHPQTAHHLTIHWLSHFAGRLSRWGAASIPPQPQVGHNWRKIGVSSALGLMSPQSILWCVQHNPPWLNMLECDGDGLDHLSLYQRHGALMNKKGEYCRPGKQYASSLAETKAATRTTRSAAATSQRKIIAPYTCQL